MRISSAIPIILACLVVVDAQHYPITGVFTGYGAAGQRPARQNILTLQKDVYQWSLYVQALQAMQNSDQQNLLSYYQVAGIHGRPYVTWDNSRNSSSISSLGYCTHNSILFLSWHRPYLALYEQILAGLVQSIAQQYRGQPSDINWFSAANQFRIPYWDWAESSSIPEFVSAQTVTITTPTGVQSVNNPLYSYKFHPLNTTDFPSSGGYLANQPQTIRFSNASALLGLQNLKSETYRALTNTANYTIFATQQVTGLSIESIHGIVHMAIANYSFYFHMADFAYSAFDPIFWLHHCNVDRIWAIWQAINRDSYIPISGLMNYVGTFSTPPNTMEYATTPLIPFSRTSSGTYWDSNSVRHTSAFGYTYPGLNDWSRTPEQQTADAKAVVNVLYSPFSFTKRGTVKPLALRQGFISVSVNKFALDTSFTVTIFIGAPPADPSMWPTAPNLVGTLPVFVPRIIVGTARLKPSGLTTNGEFLLDGALEKAGVVDRGATAVEEYLHANLTWQVQQLDGKIVPVEEVAGLRISVYDEEMIPPADVTSLPTFGKPIMRPGATRGRPGSAF